MCPPSCIRDSAGSGARGPAPHNRGRCAQACAIDAKRNWPPGGAAGFTFGFQVDAAGKAGGATLGDVFTELVDKVKSDVVLIVDDMQQTLGTEEGNNLPSQDVMYQGFLASGQRPEALQNALVWLQSRPAPPDMAFPIICTTLAAEPPRGGSTSQRLETRS